MPVRESIGLTKDSIVRNIMVGSDDSPPSPPVDDGGGGGDGLDHSPIDHFDISVPVFAKTGLYFASSDRSPDTFKLTVFDDDSGVPGDELATADILSATPGFPLFPDHYTVPVTMTLAHTISTGDYFWVVFESNSPSDTDFFILRAGFGPGGYEVSDGWHYDSPDCPNMYAEYPNGLTQGGGDGGITMPFGSAAGTDFSIALAGRYVATF